MKNSNVNEIIILNELTMSNSVKTIEKYLKPEFNLGFDFEINKIISPVKYNHPHQQIQYNIHLTLISPNFDNNMSHY